MLSPQTQVSLLRIVACGRVLRGRACGPLPVTTPLPQLFALVVATPILASSPGGSCRQHRERRPSLPRHCTDNATPRPGRRCEQQGNHHMRSLHMFQTRLQFCLARTKACAKHKSSLLCWLQRRYWHPARAALVVSIASVDPVSFGIGLIMQHLHLVADASNKVTI